MKCYYCDKLIEIDDPRKPIGRKEFSCGCNVTRLEDPEPYKIVAAPDVALIAKSHYDDEAVRAWCEARGITYTTDAVGDADATSEFAGRLCYLSFNSNKRRLAGDGQNAAYLDHIREVGHGSVTEHSYWSFVISNVSRNMTHELVRHRVGVAFSQLSTRYVDQFSDEYFGDTGDSVGVYIPPEIQAARGLLDEWNEVWKAVVKCYVRTFRCLRDQGYEKKHARSIARNILPGGACTAILFTVNARELNHIFNMRGSLHADDEIRRMTMCIYDLVKTEYLFSHWEECVDPLKGRYLRIKQPPLAESMAKLLGPNPNLDDLDTILMPFGYHRDSVTSHAPLVAA